MYQFDGTPFNPMWLVYSPPQMLPTSTLHPTVSGTKAATATATSTTAKLVKRHVGEAAEHIQFPGHEKMLKASLRKPLNLHADRWLWFGMGLTGIGGVLFMLS